MLLLVKPSSTCLAQIHCAFSVFAFVCTFSDRCDPGGAIQLRRAYSALSADAPLTAIATSDEGVIGMAQVKKDGYAI